MNTEEGVTQTLSKFVSGITFEDLPAAVVHQTKRLILDSVGCALGGISSEKGRIAVNFAKMLGGSRDATILGAGEKTSLTGAAFVNGNLGNAIDSDDTILMTHPAVPTIMGAMAVAEKENISGKELIAAVAAGYDIAIRVGGASESWLQVENGKLRTLPVHGYSWHVFGPAAAAAKILQLDEQRTAHALGLAATFAPMPIMAQWSNPVESLPLSKYHEAGWTTQGGISAALLAKEGYTAPARLLEGKGGFWKMQGRNECHFDFMVRELGKRWWIMETSLKPWPCCRFIHHALTAFTMLMREHKIRGEEMDKVVVNGSMLYSPIFHVQHPRGPVNMQFSAAHSLANAAFGIPPGPLWQDPEKADSPHMAAFREKVTIHLDPRTLEIMEEDLSGELPQQPKRVPTTVEITANRRLYGKDVLYAKGDPPSWTEGMSMSDDELVDKFRDHAVDACRMSGGWRETIEKAVAMIFGLEGLASIRDLMPLLAPWNSEGSGHR